MHRDCAELLAVIKLQAPLADPAKTVCLLQDRAEYPREIAGRRIDDLQHLGDRVLPLVGLFQLAGKRAYLPLQVGNGWGCGRSFASVGAVGAATVGRLPASTTFLLFAPPGGSR